MFNDPTTNRIGNASGVFGWCDAEGEHGDDFDLAELYRLVYGPNVTDADPHRVATLLAREVDRVLDGLTEREGFYLAADITKTAMDYAREIQGRGNDE